MMHELEKSDSLVVPTKLATKTGLLVAESMEGSGGIARHAAMLRPARTLSRASCVPGACPPTWARHQRPGVTYSRSEPYAGIPHLRIYAGGAQ